MDKKPQTPADTELLRDLEQLLAAQANSSPSQQHPVVDVGVALARAQMVKALNARIEVLEDGLRPYKDTERSMANEIQDRGKEITDMREELELLKKARSVIDGALAATHQMTTFFGRIKSSNHSHTIYHYEWCDLKGNVHKSARGISPCNYYQKNLTEGAKTGDCEIHKSELRKHNFQPIQFWSLSGCYCDKEISGGSMYVGLAEKDIAEKRGKIEDSIREAEKNLQDLKRKASNHSDILKRCEKELAEKRRQLNELLGLPPSQGK